MMQDAIVLIVEDDRDIQENLGLFLEQEGIKSHAVSNGREAFDYLTKGGRAAVILLDLMMPVMNGYEFMDALKAESGRAYAGIPIILLSAASDAAQVAKSYGVPFVKKPIDLDTLSTLLRSLIAAKG